MPPESSNSIEQERRILLAISALKDSQILLYGEQHATFQVPESSLRTRLHGTTLRAETRANSYKLTGNEEESLLQWIISMY